MLNDLAGQHIYLACGSTDLRKSIDSLAALVQGKRTMDGGINSHMAIRAGELGIPAIIGAGESLYNKWAESKVLTDSGNGLYE